MYVRAIVIFHIINMLFVKNMGDEKKENKRDEKRLEIRGIVSSINFINTSIQFLYFQVIIILLV